MPQGRYSLSQVLDQERAAWASTADAGAHPDFFYDGIIFWRMPPEPGNPPRVAPADDLPVEGWWHKDDCRCNLCRRP